MCIRDRFRNSGLDISALYRNVLQSEAFWHPDNRGAIVKSPVDIISGTARTLEFPITRWRKMPQWQEMIGMNLFAPPNVSGWNEGAAFITSGHLLNRFKVSRQMVLNPKVKVVQSKSDMSMALTGMQNVNSTNDDSSLISVQDQSGGRMIRYDDVVTQSSNSHHPTDIAMLRASAVHVQWGFVNEKTSKHIIDFVLDHLDTNEKYFHNVRFRIEKKQNNAMTLQLDSFSCWPDCIDPWPECSWVDENFTSSKNITLPWMAAKDPRWSSSHNHKCQFESLADNEKRLVSSLWAALPDLFTQVKQTNRVQSKPEHWLPIINFLEQAYQDANIQIADTAYAQYVESLSISLQHSIPEGARRPLPTPVPNITDIESLVLTLSSEDLQLHELLLPQIYGENVPDLPVNDTNRPYQYLNLLLEHPLFQLK